MPAQKNTTKTTTTKVGTRSTRRKAASVPKKKVVRKTAVKKVLAKKTAATKRPAKALKPRVRQVKKKTLSPKPKSFEQKLQEKDCVNLPINMSQRSVEKSLVLKREFDDLFRNAMYRISYVSGICFLIVGAATAFSGQFYLPNTYQSAELISSGLPTIEQATPDPDLILLSDIPNNPNASFNISFSVSHADGIEIRLVNLNNNNYQVLSPSALAEGKYRILIPVEEIESGWYRLQVKASPTNGTSLKVFDLKAFDTRIAVEPEVITVQVEPDEVSGADTDNTNEHIDQVENNETLTNTSDVEESAGSLSSNNASFALLSPSGKVLSGRVTLNVVAPEEFTQLELYARPLNSLNNRFVALAAKRASGWQFVVDTTNIPNGDYEFFAQTKSTSQVQRSTPLKLAVRNDTVSKEPVSNDSEEVGEIKVADILQIRPLVKTQEAGTESPLSDKVDNDQDYSAAGEVTPHFVADAERLVRNNSDSLDELLQRYAVAKQSGDEILIQAAREALEMKRQDLVRDTLEDVTMRDRSDDIDRLLSEKIADLQHRVDTFEEIRRERTGGDSAIDSDKDGISDFDEEKLYGTDPTKADSDNDGVTDGIEIMRGFNPNDATAEAIIEFESPQDSVGLVRSDVLAVDNITPITRVDNDIHTPAVAAEIKGRGLPNSFVTLFIFSMPTVVTVRTNADGAFVYTFDKELEDGHHDVYVAVTDNTGDIIAQSNPFSFVKEARAFTPVNAAETDFISTEPITEVAKDNAYGSVVGIGILALGIILLMLGISLRAKNENEDGQATLTESSEAKDNNPPALKKTPKLTAEAENSELT